jgi:hypothetical protein
METNRKKLYWASGWIKAGKEGGEFVSASLNPRKNIKMFLQLEDGSQIEVQHFNMFFNNEKQTDKSPDVSFATFLEE